MEITDKKKMVLKELAKILKNLRGNKSQFVFSSKSALSFKEYNTIERGLKDPQLTTVFKLAEALKISPAELIQLIVEKLPKDFSLIEK